MSLRASQPRRQPGLVTRLLGAGINAIATGLLLSLAGCTSVPVPAQDSTPPDVTMDIFGIPLPPSAGPGDEEFSVNAGCCDVRRNPPASRKLNLLASGKDPEGVRRITISVQIVMVCTHSVLHDSIVAGQNQDPTPSAPAQAPSLRVAQGSLTMQDHLANRCPNFNVVEQVDAFVHGEAENYQGVVTKTKTVDLRWP